MTKKNNINNISCKHCGDSCPVDYPTKDDYAFCCQGCLMVYQLLKDNNLGQYYQLEEVPGISQRNKKQSAYDYLDEEDIINRLVEFREEGVSILSFEIPQIHCASCVWLLENLHRINPGIKNSRVNFLKKRARISYDEKIISLKNLVALLSKIGYEPVLKLSSFDQKTKSNQDKKLL